MLNEVIQGGDAFARIMKLIADSAQTDEQKQRLIVRASEIFATLIRAGVVAKTEGPFVKTEPRFYRKHLVLYTRNCIIRDVSGSFISSASKSSARQR